MRLYHVLRYRCLWLSILRLGSQKMKKKLYSLTTSFVVSHFNLPKMQNISASKSRRTHIHIYQMTTKSNNTLKFYKRNIQRNIHKIKEAAYKTYARPLLEYSATIWYHWQKKYINQIEMVQHRAVRYIFNDFNLTSSVSSVLSWHYPL